MCLYVHGVSMVALCEWKMFGFWRKQKTWALGISGNLKGMVADLTSWQPSQSGGNTAVSQCNLFLYISIHLYAHHNFHTHTHTYIYIYTCSIKIDWWPWIEIVHNCIYIYIYAHRHSFSVDQIASPHVKSPIKSLRPRMPLEPVRFSLRTHGESHSPAEVIPQTSHWSVIKIQFLWWNPFPLELCHSFSKDL